MSKSCGSPKPAQVISEPTFEPCENICEPLSLQMPDDHVYVSDFISEPLSDDMLNQSQFSEVVSTNNCSTKAHCQTCTCF